MRRKEAGHLVVSSAPQKLFNFVFDQVLSGEAKCAIARLVCQCIVETYSQIKEHQELCSISKGALNTLRYFLTPVDCDLSSSVTTALALIYGVSR
ncbi:hypothetical protein PoB_006088200 [Plakobranchus ocellatus]|uniref:Uncharacterized protein n=1 Tax=Plakobranchus ocellatus TaxID=259542 RepID=A0AAV4CR75_9GAST|nr:hypothetical protein PoB_006088200 [Plakobranchus ocellatus]